MKKLLFIVTLFGFLACDKGSEKKPDKLLSEQQMEDIFYDLSLLQAIKSYTPKSLDDARVDAKNYVYRKYDIDSALFAQNHRYYASRLEQYKKIQDNVNKRLTKEKEKFEPEKKADKKPGKKEQSKASKDTVVATKTVLKKLGEK